ncbi:hypothetical protein BDZ89DRAFT_1254732 [Hymenopellis radicata]|nr:hypothetical protein BDZ89DRAFT_1254732 [Hymenopellis radicata]
MYRIMADDDDEDEPQEWDDPEEADPWGGSQFDEDAADDDVVNTNQEDPADAGTSDQPRVGMMWAGDWEDVRAYSVRETEESYSDSDCESVAESENEYVLDYGEFLRTMQIDETRDTDGKRGYVPTLDPMRSQVPRSLKRPRRTNQEKRCLAVFLEVNGHKAFTLCDSGCTTELMSHDFAHLVQPELFELDEPVTIQLVLKEADRKLYMERSHPSHTTVIGWRSLDANTLISRMLIVTILLSEHRL